MVLAKESCCCFKVNFHRGEFAIVADADKHCVDKAPGWISSLPLLPKEWQRAALCSSASRRGQLHCFVCFILLRGSQMGFFLLEAPVKASVVFPAIWRSVLIVVSSCQWAGFAARHGGLLQSSYKWQVLLMFIPVGAAQVGVAPKWLCSVYSPCRVTGFRAHLARQSWERMTCHFLQDGLEGKVRDAATSSLPVT